MEVTVQERLYCEYMIKYEGEHKLNLILNAHGLHVNFEEHCSSYEIELRVVVE